jgi:hypothetical protein
MNAPKRVKMAGTQNNTAGGVKKQGLAPTVGLVASVSGVYRMRLGCPCPGNKSIISNTKACGGGVGGSIVRPRC